MSPPAEGDTYPTTKSLPEKCSKVEGEGFKLLKHGGCCLEDYLVDTKNYSYFRPMVKKIINYTPDKNNPTSPPFHSVRLGYILNK